LDWGIAKVIHHEVKHTIEGQLMGTPQYLSPEQARGQEVSPQTDVYSLGVMAYELFLEQLPFEAETAAEVMAMHLRAPPPPRRVARPPGGGGGPAAGGPRQAPGPAAAAGGGGGGGGGGGRRPPGGGRGARGAAAARGRLGRAAPAAAPRPGGVAGVRADRAA